MSKPHRHERLEEAIAEAITEVVQGELRDPRLPAILTITGVKLAKDLRAAKVFFTQSPEDEDAIDDTIEALRHAVGFIRGRVAEDVAMRNVPELTFHFDTATKATQRIEELLKQSRRDETPATE